MNDALAALIVMGVSGSGKSTVAKALAEKLGWRYEDADDFHTKENIAKMKSGIALTDSDREPWLQSIATEIDRVINRGERIVIACSALKKSYRRILIHGRSDVRLVFLDGSRDLIAKRSAARTNHFMPAELLDSQFDALEPPGADERPIVASINNSINGIVADISAALASNPTDSAQ